MAAKSASILLIAIALGNILPTVHAENNVIHNPEFDYVTSPNPELKGMQKSEILRLDLDLTGGGKPTVFLTLKGAGSGSGPVWTAYEPIEGGYERIDYANSGDGTIEFIPFLYHAGKFPELAEDGGLLVLYPAKGGGGNLVRYDIKNGEAHSEQVRVLDYKNAADQKLFESLFKRKPQEPLPPEYFKKPPYKILSATQIKEDAPSENSKLNKLAETIVTPTLLSRSTYSQATPVSAPVQKTSPTPNTDAKISSSSFPVVPLIVVVALLVGALVFILHRKN